LDVSLDVLASQGVDRSNVVTALNKVDLLDGREREQCRQAIGDRAPTPIPVSVTEGTNLDGLVDTVTDRLPTERAEIALPNCDEAMALVSRAYDRATVEDVAYGGETVRLVVRGRPDVVAKLESRAAEVTAA
ncbi:GTPase HflX, partial [Halobacteriales archaeon QS_5_68_33]